MMGINYNSAAGRTKGLVFNVDFGLTNSYPRSGTAIYDISNGVVGTLSGAATYTFPGLTFANTNSLYFGNIPLVSPLSLTTNFTIDISFTPTAYQASTFFGLTNVLLSKGPASTYNYAVQCSNDTTLTFIKRTSPESLVFTTFTVPSMIGKYNRATISINGSAVSCYMNGSLIETKNFVGNAIAAVNNDPFYISSPASSGSTPFLGIIYSCRIYNESLLLNDHIGNNLYYNNRVLT